MQFNHALGTAGQKKRSLTHSLELLGSCSSYVCWKSEHNNGRISNGPEVFHPSRAMTSLLLLRSLDENVIVTTVIKFPKYVACQVRDIKKLEGAFEMF